jgi:hypothetical protein
MLWDDLRTLIMLRLTTQPPCMCAGCQRGRRASQSFRCRRRHQPKASAAICARYELHRLDQPSQHYQHCRQTQNCHCEKYHRLGRHLCQKFDHLRPPG